MDILLRLEVANKKESDRKEKERANKRQLVCDRHIKVACDALGIDFGNVMRLLGKKSGMYVDAQRGSGKTFAALALALSNAMRGNEAVLVFPLRVSANVIREFAPRLLDSGLVEGTINTQTGFAVRGGGRVRIMQSTVICAMRGFSRDAAYVFDDAAPPRELLERVDAGRIICLHTSRKLEDEMCLGF